MINFDITHIGQFVEVKVNIDTITHDLGWLDINKIKLLEFELSNALDDLQEYRRKIEPRVRISPNG